MIVKVEALYNERHRWISVVVPWTKYARFTWMEQREDWKRR